MSILNQLFFNILSMLYAILHSALITEILLFVFLLYLLKKTWFFITKTSRHESIGQALTKYMLIVLELCLVFFMARYIVHILTKIGMMFT